jgi:hypothetical protein
MTNYFRTAKGSHRHTNWTCANFRRSIHLGDVIELTAAEAADYAPCDVCCPGDEVKAHAEKAAAKADAMCANAGVTHPKRIQSACRSCGKVGKVDRRTGSLRAHKPQS